MLVLVLVACLDGHDRRVVQLAGEMPLHQCMVYSQPAAAKWIEAHPGFKGEETALRPANGCGADCG